MVITTWRDLVGSLDAALSFAHDLGLGEDVPSSRFTAFRGRLDQLTGVHEREGNEAAFHRFIGELELNAVALTESHELVTLLPYLQSLPEKAVKRKLKIALQGPELPADEDTNSNAARNTMFELNLASRLHCAGLEVEIGRGADLEFTFDGVRWFGECKRPYRIESIEPNLKRACRQLGQRLSSSRLAARGLLAISVSRPLATKAPYLEVAGEAELTMVLREHVGSIIRLMEERMLELDECRGDSRLGLLFGHLIVPALSGVGRIPTSVQYSAGTDVCLDRSGDGKRLWTVIERTFMRSEDTK